MTDKRLYYTDVRKALWMVDEFGIKLWYDNHQYNEPQPATRQILITSLFDAGVEGGNDWGAYSVDKDSYHIFEPQEGDFCQTKCCGVKRFSNRTVEEWHWHKWDGIIQRNNKAFFMPEMEGK